MSVPWLAYIAFWAWWLVVLATVPRMGWSDDHPLVWAALVLGAIMNTIGWIEADLGIANRAISYIVPTTTALLLGWVLLEYAERNGWVPYVLAAIGLVTIASILTLDADQTEVAWQSVMRLAVGVLALRRAWYGADPLAVAVLTVLVVPLPGLWLKEVALTQQWWTTYLVGYHWEIGTHLVGVGLLGRWMWQ